MWKLHCGTAEAEVKINIFWEVPDIIKPQLLDHDKS